MEQTTTKFTWPEFIEAFRDYSGRNYAKSGQPNKKMLAGMEKAMPYYYPAIVNDPYLIESVDYQEFRKKVNKEFEGEEPVTKNKERFVVNYDMRICLRRMQSFAWLHRLKRDVNEGAVHTDTDFFTTNHVMECFKQHMLKAGWTNFAYASKGICGEKTGEGKKSSFFAAAIRTCWQEDYRYIRKEPEWETEYFLREDTKGVKTRLQRAVFDLIDAKIENQYTDLYVAFANDTATTEILQPYFPSIKSLGFRIFGVKSAEDVVEF
jgi:hypothetical protein